MADDDDWGITPDFKIDMTEQEQRWGSKVVTGPGRMGHIDMKELLDSTIKADADSKKNSQPKASFGYGGKFGVEKDRMDQSAVGNEHHEVMAQHASQKDCSMGFGGKYGVQNDRQDKSAVGYDHHEEVAQHASQKDHSVGFGGKYGVQTDRADASSHGYKDKENSDQNEPQKQKSFNVEGASSTASALRAKFESLAMKQSQPQERPQRPVGKLPKQFSPQPTEVKQTPEPVRQPSPEPAHLPEPVCQPLMEPIRQPSPEPVRQPSPEPVHLPEPVTQPLMEPIRQPSPEPVRQPSPEPVQVQQEPEPTPQPAVANSEITAMALYDFVGSQDDELTFNAGDEITNITKFDESWWFGMVGDRQGIFPVNFVSEN